MPDPDDIATAVDGECWNCGGVRLILTPDPQMGNMTDMIVCLDCGELQDIEEVSE